MSVANVKRNRTKLHRNEESWNQAIADAKQKIEQSARRTERLKQILSDLEEMKKAGVIWPGIDEMPAGFLIRRNKNTRHLLAGEKGSS